MASTHLSPLKLQHKTVFPTTLGSKPSEDSTCQYTTHDDTRVPQTCFLKNLNKREPLFIFTYLEQMEFVIVTLPYVFLFNSLIRTVCKWTSIKKMKQGSLYFHVWMCFQDFIDTMVMVHQNMKSSLITLWKKNNRTLRKISLLKKL